MASFCDGASVVCPCGNGASTVGGCPNSNSPGAAHLSFGGVAATVADTPQLFCTGMPAGVSSLFFQGAGAVNGAAGALFGDRVRCPASLMRRLGAKSTSAANATVVSYGVAPQLCEPLHERDHQLLQRARRGLGALSPRTIRVEASMAHFGVDG